MISAKTSYVDALLTIDDFVHLSEAIERIPMFLGFGFLFHQQPR